MQDIRQQLDNIKKRISDSDFLANEGLSNEVGIHTFCYDPADELIVRHFIDKIAETLSDDYRVIVRDMYKIFLEILTDKKIIDKVAALEEKRGRDYILGELQKSASPRDFLAKMLIDPIVPKHDVLFLTGAGAVYPYMRSHIMLNIMQEPFANIPVVLFYPGTFNGQDLSLFGEFFDGNYYRTFNLL